MTKGAKQQCSCHSQYQT